MAFIACYDLDTGQEFTNFNGYNFYEFISISDGSGQKMRHTHGNPISTVVKNDEVILI